MKKTLYIYNVINTIKVMRGYLTKTKDEWTLTIRDNSDIPHRYKISNFKKFCNKILDSSVEDVRKKRNIGQFVVDKLGFFENELWELDALQWRFP